VVAFNWSLLYIGQYFIFAHYLGVWLEAHLLGLGGFVFISCVFEGIYALDVINMSKDLLYKDNLKEFHVYETQDYFNTIQLGD
jgi:hypothetical protein